MNKLNKYFVFVRASSLYTGVKLIQMNHVVHDWDGLPTLGVGAWMYYKNWIQKFHLEEKLLNKHMSQESFLASRFLDDIMHIEKKNLF